MYGVIYKAVSKIDGRVYIGLSTNFRQRVGSYKYKVKHPTRYFEFALKKYGFENFDFYIIDYADSLELLNYKEQFWIRIYNCDIKGIGFNLESGGSDKKKTSDETRKKMSEAKIGKVTSDETKAKLSKIAKGRVESEETKQKKSKAMIGKTHSEESKLKMSESHIGLAAGEKHYLYGKHLPEETKLKLSESHIGKNSGEDNYLAVLNNEKVKIIRELYESGNYSYQIIADQFNVTKGCIRNIIKYKTWKNI